MVEYPGGRDALQRGSPPLGAPVYGPAALFLTCRLPWHFSLTVPAPSGFANLLQAPA